jgi:hypothetical protein
MTVRFSTLFFIVVSSLLVSPAWADDYMTNVDAFIIEYDKGGREAKIYAQGLVDGFGIYRAAAGPRVFCPPTAVDITLDQVVDIMRKHSADRPNLKSKPTRVVMLTALGEAFPCK